MRLMYGLCLWYVFILCSEATAQDIICSVPPAPKPITVTQPDGSIIKVLARGNPFLHWNETTDGYTIVKSKEGLYEYAVKEEGELLPSGIRAVDPDFGNTNARRAPVHIEKHLKPEPDSLTNRRMRQFSPLGNNARGDQVNAGIPPSGNVRVLCILIEYPDLKHTFDKDNFAKLMNGPLGDGRLSFAEFYAKSSFGKFNVTVDVAGWYQAKKKYTSYSSSGGSLVTEAVNAANLDGVDFTQYDNNKDGVVDGIIVVHAGPGGEEGLSSQYIWSHMSYISTEVDGVYVRPYCINPEVRNGGYGHQGMVGMGTFAHEFGHLLGLPDLYDTDGGSEGIGEWGLMGSGNWVGMENRPAGFCAWSKEKLGWIKPVDITEDFQSFKLKPASQYPEAFKIRTTNPDEYFLVENRQKTGIDSEISGHGLAIWHVNTKKTSLYPTFNMVNADPSHKGIDLEEADGRYDLDNGWNRSDNTDLYPADFYQLDLFDYTTDPNSDFTEKSGSTTFTGVSIGNIKENNGIISFTYRRDMPDLGEECGTPAVALKGVNYTPKLNFFFEYVMPQDGTVYISVDDPDLWVGGTLYRSCKEVDKTGAGTAIYLDGASRTENKHKIDFVRKGQKLIFYWEFNLKSDIGGEEGFSWNLAIETGGVASQDSLALAAVYKNMGGEDWYNKANWLKKPVSSWEGVTVKGGRVTGLELSELQNSFPDEFYNLDALEVIDLQSMDSLTGTLDQRMAGLKRLKYLYIDTYGLEIDFIDKLTAFTEISDIILNVYKINDELPENINALSQLENLTVRAQSFKSKIPEKLGSLPKLISLTLTGEMYGTIPDALGKAMGLRFIDLSYNKLTGKIPDSFAELNKLEYLNLEDNQLSGAIPAGVFNLPFLTSFYAGYNQLESVPKNFFSSESLDYIDLSHNKIKGSLPQSVPSETPREIYVYLDHNQLSGKIPESLKNITFSYLDLSYNQLEGQMPKVDFLEGLDISYNHFNGLPHLTDESDEYYKNLYCQHNYLSFDDLLPNLDILFCFDCEYDEEEEYDEYQQFRPQDSVNLNIAQAITGGGSYTIDLGIDAQVENNEYRWFKDDKLIKTTKTSKLTIADFSTEKEGDYRCEVSNAQFDNFSLYYDGIKLKLGNKKAQKITIAALENKKYGDPAFRLRATSNGTQEIKFEVVEGPVQISGDTVSIEGAGNVKIRAYNAGSEQFNPAEAFVEFSIEKAAQKIIYESPSEKTYGDEDFLLNVNTSSQLPVSLTLEEGAVTLNGKLVIIKGAGNVKITARQKGNGNFYPADPVEISFRIAQAVQQLSVSDIEDQTFGTPPFTVDAASDQNLPVKLEALNDNISVEGNVVTILKAGEAQLRVSQAGDADIRAAEPVIKTFTIHKAAQLLYFQRIEDKMTTEGPFELQAYSNQGLPVSYRIIEGEKLIMLEGNRVTILGAGFVQIEASQEGDENHTPAESVRHGFNINDSGKAAQTISFQAEIPDTVRIRETYTFQIEVSSGLTPEITVEGPAEVQGDQLIFQEEGEVRIIVKQTGNDQYNAAPTIVKEYVVTKILKEKQTIAYTPIEDKVYGDAPFAVDFKASSGLPVSFHIEGPATISGNTITLTGAGVVKLTFYQGGSDSYLPVAETTLTFEVAKASQIIDFQVLPLNDTSYNLQGSSSSLLPVSYALTEGKDKGVINDNILYVNESGLVTVMATQEGNENYLPATPVSKTIEVKVVTGVPKELLSMIRIYPNPSPDKFYITSNGKPFHTEVKVHNAAGKTVLEQYWQGDMGEIDLIGKPQGVYFVRFTYEGELMSIPVVLK